MRLRSLGGARPNQQSEALCSSMPTAWHTRALQCSPAPAPCPSPAASRQHRRRLHQRAAIDHRLELELSDNSIARSLPHNAGLLQPQDLGDGMGVAPAITPRDRINRILKRAGSLLELRVILEQEYLSFDAANAAHALNRLAKMHRSLCSSLAEAGMLTAEMLAQQRAEHVAPCLEVLDQLVRTHISQMSARDVATSLWSYATLDYYDRNMFDLLCSRGLQLTDAMNPHDCSNILVAFGRWGHYQPDLLKRLPQVLLDHMYDAKPFEISQCLWGFARLRVPGAPGRVFLLACCETIHASMHSYGSQELTNVLWSLTRLQFYPGLAFLQRCESVLINRLKQMTRSRHRHAGQRSREANGHHGWPLHTPGSQQEFGTAQGVGPGGPAHMVNGQAAGQPVSVVQPLGPEPSGQLYGVEQGHANGHSLHTSAMPLHHELVGSQDVAMALYAFGRMRYKAVLILDELPLSLGTWLHTFSTADLVCLVNGYANARHYHHGVLEAVAPLITERSHSLNIDQLVTVLSAYSVFQHRPASDQRMIGALANALTHRLRNFRPQTFALVAKACANLQCRPEPLLQAIVQGSFERLVDFRPDEMAHLLYGLSFLVSRAPACELPSARRTSMASSNRVLVPAATVQAMQNSGSSQSGGSSGASGSTPTGLHPALKPEEMQLFYGVVRRCMSLMDEPTHPFASAKYLHHQVLNSIIFSCSRIGYTPWTLIEFAETKGYRLTNPKVTEGDTSQAGGRPGRVARSPRAPTDTSSTSNASSNGATSAQAPAAQPGSSGDDVVWDEGQVQVEAPPAAFVTFPGQARRGQHTAPPPDFDTKPTPMRRRAGLMSERRTLFDINPDGGNELIG